MELAGTIAQLPITHQAAFSALNCEKMLLSIANFDKQEVVSARPLFEKAIAVVYAFALGQSSIIADCESLKDNIETQWPDLDETENDFASYAFDAFIAMSEALELVISGKTIHAANCSAAVLDTVDMYVQETAEDEPPAAELQAFVQANPFMIQEMSRQTALLDELRKMPAVSSASLTYLQSLNEQAKLIDFAALPY